MVDITQCVTSPLSLTLCGLSSPPLGPQAGGARSFGITSHGAPGHLLCNTKHSAYCHLRPPPVIPFSFEPQPHRPGPPTNMSSHSPKVICLARHNSKLMHLQLRDSKQTHLEDVSRDVLALTRYSAPDVQLGS